MKIEIVKGEDNSVSEFFSSSDTPETDSVWDKYINYPYNCGAGDLRILAQRLERERDEATCSLEKERIALNYLIKRAMETERERNEARDMVEKLTEQGLAMMDENKMLKRQIKELKKKYE